MEATTLPPSTLLINHLRSSTHPFLISKSKSFPRKTFTQSLSSATNPMSLYDVLGVKRDACLMDVKKSYRNLAKLYHPDSTSDYADSRDFMVIRDAYATLSDPRARALYDMSIGVGQRIGSFAGSGYRHGWRWETDQCW